MYVRPYGGPRVRVHRSTSSYCDRLPSFMPMTNTLPDATQAKTNRMKSNTNFANHVDWARNDRSLEVSGGDRTGHQEEGGLHLL